MIEEAAEFAREAHRGMFRKGTEIPYIVHPIETAVIVASFTDDEEEMCIRDRPDKGKVPLAQIYNPVYRPDAPHICIGNDSIHHDWIVPGSPFIRIAGQQA